MGDILPASIAERRDKMGFPVPLGEWMKGDLREFVLETFSGPNAQARPYLDPGFDIRTIIDRESKFARNVWGLFSLELWQQQFHDRQADWRLQPQPDAVVAAIAK